jgi:hypothetical protein
MGSNFRKKIKYANFSSMIVSGILLCGSLLGIIELQKQEMLQQRQQKSTEGHQQIEDSEKRSLQWFSKFPTFGLQNLTADWIYLNFIQYFGDTTLREKLGYSLCPSYFKTLVNRDPQFVNALIMLDVCTALFAGEPLQSLQELQLSTETLKPKMEAVTIRPYYVWQAIGINQLLFQGKPLQAKQSYEKAVSWAKDYYDPESRRFIANMQKSITYLAENPNSKMAQIGGWFNILNNNPDKRTLDRVIKEIELLGGKVKINSQGQFSVELPQGTD